MKEKNIFAVGLAIGAVSCAAVMYLYDSFKKTPKKDQNKGIKTAETNQDQVPQNDNSANTPDQAKFFYADLK